MAVDFRAAMIGSMPRTLLLLLLCLAALACDETSAEPTATGTATGQGGATSSATTTSSGLGGGHGGAGGLGGSGGEGAAAGSGAIRVLFIGNSYTFVNDLPSLVSTIDPGGPTITTDSLTAGGAQLQDHAANPEVATRIQLGWDAVVLQGQSVEPLLVPSQFFSGATALATMIAPTGATAVMFETWARVSGHDVYQESWSGGDPLAMQAGLRSAYQQAADDAGGVMAPVGDAWEQSLAQSSITLHSNDGSHPTLAGSYLAAAVFYLVLTAQTAYINPAPAPPGLAEADATALRNVAEATVGGS